MAIFVLEKYFTVTKDFGNGWRNLVPKPRERTNFRRKKGPNWGKFASALLQGSCLDESASESHTQNSTQTAPWQFRAACPQNETAPEKFLNRYEKRFEKREKGSEKRSETRLKNF